jgi:uncharacterized OB-fold protein
MSTLAIELSQTARIWRRAVAPLAEWVARTLWSNPQRSSREAAPPTRLTQRHKREAKGSQPFPKAERTTHPPRICRGCGKSIRPEHNHCILCAAEGAKARMIEAAKIGRLVSHSPEARAKQSATRRRHARAVAEWDPSTQPAWLTRDTFLQQIQPFLALVSLSKIAAAIGVSRGYAGRIQEGYVPHPRHWQALARLANVSSA